MAQTHKTKLERCRDFMRYIHQNPDKVHTADSIAAHFKISVATVRSVLYDADYKPVFMRSALDRRVVMLSGQWPGNTKFNLEKEELFKADKPKPAYAVRHLNKATPEVLQSGLSIKGWQALERVLTKDMVSPLEGQDYKDYYALMNLSRQLSALLSVVRSPDPETKAAELIDEPDKWIFQPVIQSTKSFAAKRTDRKQS
jgi:hypothetical protein